MVSPSSVAGAGSRRAIRRAVRLSCEVVGAHSDRPLPFMVTDMSTTGLWLQTVHPLRAGETVVVCFDIPGSKRAVMPFAEVVRVTTDRRRVNRPGVGMALELLDLEPREADALATFLDRHRQPIPRRRRPVFEGSGAPVRPPRALA
ncbi:MAG: PilZ domain-containing protein [Myxococcota bacterium]